MSDEAQPPLQPAGAPAAGAPAEPASTSKAAVWSLILGILSTFCLWLLGSIPAIILGVVAMRNIDRSQGRLAGKGLALAGIITGSVGILSGLTTLGIVAGISVPAFSQATHRAVEVRMVNELKTIMIASHHYASDHDGNFPPSLDALVPDYLETEEALVFKGHPVDPGESRRYLYRPGLKADETRRPMDEMILLGPELRPGRRPAAFLDGRVEILVEPVEAELLGQFE